MTRAKSSDATLSGLVLSEVTLSPTFAASTLEYAVTVGNEVAQTTVTAVVAGEGAAYVVEVGGAVDQDGIVPLAVGETVIAVVVTAGDGETTQTYSVTVTRAKSSDATLSALTLKDDESTSVTLDPAFSGDHTSYAASVGHGVETLTVAAEPSEADADVALLPPDADGERDGHQVVLAIGVNVISIGVTAVDGDSQHAYTVRITRQAAPNVLLKSLSISDANLLPPFDSAILEYAVELEHDVNVVTVEAAPADPNATAVVMLDGFVDGDGLIALPVGPSVIEVVATAKTGTHSKTYTIVVNRAVRKPVPLPTPVRSEDPPGPRPTPVRPTPTPTAVASGIGVSAAHIDLGVADTKDNKAQATLEVWSRGSGRMLLNFFDDAPWLRASPPFVVSTGPGDKHQVTLLADASFLGPGSHSAAFYVHVDELDSRTTVSVTLTVAPRPTPTPIPTPAAAPTAIPTPTPASGLTGPASAVPTATITLPEASNSPTPLPPEPTPAPTPAAVEVPTPVAIESAHILVGTENLTQVAEGQAEGPLAIDNTVSPVRHQPEPTGLPARAYVMQMNSVTVLYSSTGKSEKKRLGLLISGIILIDVLASWRLSRKLYLV